MRPVSWQKLTAVAVVVASPLGLSACGTTPPDRMLSGGLLGSGAGALIGSVTGSVGRGALIGGVAGAALGGLTRPSDIYLGEPPWNSHYRHAYTYHHTARSNCITHYTETQRITTCPRHD